MFGRDGIHGWRLKISALTREGTRFLLSQIGRGQDEEDGEFLLVVVGRVPAWCFCFFSEVEGKASVADCGGRVGKRFKERNEGFSWIVGEDEERS